MHGPASLRSRRHLALALAVALGIAVVVGLACYDLPQPECGFRCGPNAECPDDYTCNAGDGRCHKNGSPADLVCGAIAIDAPIGDAGLDAEDAAVDAAIDAEIDAAIDAPIDAAVDAEIDAAVDAPDDAPGDAPVDAEIDAT